MRLRDIELDVATLLEAAGLGTLSGDTPTLYPGPFPTSAPDEMIAVIDAGGDPPEKYLADTGLSLHRDMVTVLVRGTRAPGSDKETGDRARAAWSALYDLQPDGYVRVEPTEGRPTRQTPDDEGRPRWVFSVELEYLSASAPGAVVPQLAAEDVPRR
ncbi:hypothetical protein JQX13_38885 [Archangium violaceum]|uniref:hypothetical protein n=1 Tax=Archangium violaceum TaxID=83451 RepID=UPI00193C008A|nr:hypothetical protein [Archangium violaceum]QRK06049.1 hypothetical protein JQX13_38885 [Archangium violaceum]